MPLLDAVQASSLAQTIAESRWITAVLSSTHLLGFTLLMGSAVLGHLRLAGVFLRDRPVGDVTRAASRGLFVGLTVSAATGLFLFVPRASSAAGNSTFQLKLLLLLAALVVQTLALPWVARQPAEPVGAARVTGSVGLLLWLGVAVAGCAYILFE